MNIAYQSDHGNKKLKHILNSCNSSKLFETKNITPYTLCRWHPDYMQLHKGGC